jgi:hypothetical protein
MLPKRQSTPRDAALFCTSLSAMLGVVGAIFCWKGRITPQTMGLGLAALAAAAAAAWFRPAWAQPVHRAAMALARGLSLVVGPVLLSVAYCVAVIPLGLLLRVMGKDLLILKRPGKASLWHPVKPGGGLKKMF